MQNWKSLIKLYNIKYYYCWFHTPILCFVVISFAIVFFKVIYICILAKEYCAN